MVLNLPVIIFTLSQNLQCVILFCLVDILRGELIVFRSQFNDTIEFEHVQSNFGNPIPSSGVSGFLQASQPLEACEPLQNEVSKARTAFVIIRRGTCNFDTKVGYAEQAGFKAAIVFNNRNRSTLVRMQAEGNLFSNITIPSVFVRGDSGYQILAIIDNGDTQVVINRSEGQRTKSIAAIWLTNVLVIVGVFLSIGFCYCFIAHLIQRRRETRTTRPSIPLTQMAPVLGSLPLSSLPLPGREVQVGSHGHCSWSASGSTDTPCAICLDEFKAGDMLRVLSCNHGFHKLCIEEWLQSQQSLCPVCRRDPRDSIV